MKTVSELDLAITKLQKTISQLEADRVKNTSLLETAKNSRARDSLAALASDDKAAQNRLVKARTSSREIELLLEDLVSAIDAAQQQVEQLQAERLESHRAERLVEFQKMAMAAKLSAMAIDGMIATLGALLAEHLVQLRSLTNLSSEAGQPRIFGMRHLWRVINATFHKILPHEFPNQHAFYRDKTWEQILTEQIDRTDNQSEQSEQVTKAS